LDTIQNKLLRIDKLITENGIALSNTREIWNELNNFFVNIESNMVFKISHDNASNLLTTTSSRENAFFFEPITPHEVWHEINSLNKKSNWS